MDNLPGALERELMRMARKLLEEKEIAEEDIAPRPGSSLWSEDQQRSIELSNEGVRLFKEKRYDEAIEKFKSALLQDDQDIFAHRGLALSYVGRGDFEEAEEHFAKHPLIKPSEIAEAFKLKAGKLFRERNFEDAIKAQRKSLHYDPNSKVGQYLLSVMLTQKGDLEGAVHAFDEYFSCEQDWHDGNVVHTTGEVTLLQALVDGLKTKGDAEKVAPLLYKCLQYPVRIYQAAVQRDPKDGAAHFCLGLTYQGIGQLKAAISSYKTALQLEPQNEKIKEALDKALAEKND